VSVVDTLIELIDIPSVTGNEGRICTTIAERMMRTHGQDAVRRINNSLVVGRRTDRPLILLVGHVDTVPNQGQGAAYIADGRVHGLGASDMKAGVASMLHLMEDSSVILGEYDVVSVFYEKEEGPLADNGLEPVLQRIPWLADASFAIVTEPTDLEIQVGCVGTLNATVTFSGKAAHSARPWLGENAVTKAGSFLAAMHAREPEPIEIGDLTFYEVVSVTRAHGGIANNVLPGSFELNVNYRFGPHRTTDEAIARLTAIVEAADSIEVNDVAPSAPVPQENAFLERFVAGSGAAITPKQAWTDVARLAEYDIAAVNYGPGETSQAHQVNESVPISYVEQAHEVLMTFLRSRP
jgi:succinyl-diaminopimelate desuccinylase